MGTRKPYMTTRQRKQAMLDRILERCSHECAYCGTSLRYTTRPCEYEPDMLVITSGQVPTLDHIIPKCRGGSNKEDNLTAACLSCNAQKRDKTADEYRAWKAARA